MRRRRRYTSAVDYFSLGVTLYRFGAILVSALVLNAPPYPPAPEVSFTHQLLSLELWLLGLRLPRAGVASIFPLCGWVWGAQGFGVAVLSYTLYTAMVWSSGDYAPARWNELMVDQQLDDSKLVFRPQERFAPGTRRNIGLRTAAHGRQKDQEDPLQRHKRCTLRPLIHQPPTPPRDPAIASDLSSSA